MQIISILHAPTWLRLICARDGHKGEKGISKKKVETSLETVWKAFNYVFRAFPNH